MTVLDRLVLQGWLRPLAPRLAHDAPVACESLAPAAVDVLAPSYGGHAPLSRAVGACLRRAICTGLANVRGLGLDPAVTKTVMEAEQQVLAWLRVDAELETIDRVLRTIGVPDTPEVISEVLDAWTHLAGEVLPRTGPSAMEALVQLLKAGRITLEGENHTAATRDLAAAHSLLGDRDDAMRLFVESGDIARERLERADHALEDGRVLDAESLAQEALKIATANGEHTYVAAAQRRLGTAAMRDGRQEQAAERFRQALDVARQAGDGRGEAEALEELSELAAMHGEIDRAVTLLDDLRRLARARVDLTGEARALQLAGRLLCERGNPGVGLVMLAQAKEWCDLSNPPLADLIEQYVVGFGFTLTPAEWAQLQPLLDGPRQPVIDRAFAAARCRAPFPPEGN